MNILIFSILLSFALSTEIKQVRYMWIPDGEGKLHFVDLEAMDDTVARFNPFRDNGYHLFTRSNRNSTQNLIHGDSNSVLSSNFDGNKPTKFIVHGWHGSIRSVINTLLINAFLDHGDYNVIAVDWSAGSSGLYSPSVLNVPISGRSVAEFIDWLISITTLRVENIHLLGHSLGGHKVGVIGRSVTSGRIPYVTALDPAYPGWNTNENRLTSEDGEYVEVIHTNSGLLGMDVPLGDADFYPNGGKIMTGCLMANIACSHFRAYEYIAEAINNDRFSSVRCASYEEIKGGECTNTGSLNMGGISSKPGHPGVYYLKTASSSPFALG